MFPLTCLRLSPQTPALNSDPGAPDPFMVNPIRAGLNGPVLHPLFVVDVVAGAAGAATAKVGTERTLYPHLMMKDSCP